MAGIYGTVIVCAFLVSSLRISPCSANQCEIELDNFTVHDIEPDEYQTDKNTTITFSANLTFLPGNDTAGDTVQILLLVLSLNGATAVGEVPVSVERQPGRSVTVHRVISTQVTIPRNACDNRSAELELCAGVSCDGVECIEFGKDIEEGGAGTINCETWNKTRWRQHDKAPATEDTPIPWYAILLLVVVPVFILLIIVCLCRREWVKRHRGPHQRDTENPDGGQGSLADYLSRPRKSLQHIYEDISNRLTNVHVPFRSRRGGDESNYEMRLSGGRVNDGFQTGNENNRQNGSKISLNEVAGDPAESTPNPALGSLQAKRPSHPNEYILEDVGPSSPEWLRNRAPSVDIPLRNAPTPPDPDYDTLSDRQPDPKGESSHDVWADGDPLDPNTSPDLSPYPSPYLVSNPKSHPDTRTPMDPNPVCSGSGDTSRTDPDPDPGPLPVPLNNSSLELNSKPEPPPKRSRTPLPNRNSSPDQREPHFDSDQQQTSSVPAVPDRIPGNKSQAAPSPLPAAQRRPLVDDGVNRLSLPPKPGRYSRQDESEETYVPPRPKVPVKPRKLSQPKHDDIPAKAPDRPRLPEKPRRLSQPEPGSPVIAQPRPQLPEKPRKLSQPGSVSPNEDKPTQDWSWSSTSSANTSAGPELPEKPRVRLSRSDPRDQNEEQRTQDWSTSSTSSTSKSSSPKPKRAPLSVYKPTPDTSNISSSPSLKPKIPKSPSPSQKSARVDKKVMDMAIRKVRDSTVKPPNLDELDQQQDSSHSDVDSSASALSPTDPEFMQAVMENYLALMYEISTGEEDYEVAIKREKERVVSGDPVAEQRTLMRRKSYAAQLTLKQKRKTIESGEVYVNQWNKSWEFNRANLDVDREKPLGEGQFGKVFKAFARGVRGRTGDTLVAVKELKEGATTNDKDEFLKELAIHTIMKTHPHVVELLGCCIRDEPICIITEYLAGGSLLGFLRGKPTAQTGREVVRHYIARFGLHIARGMAYVSQMEIVHRDLAARNILISEEKVCKVSDFGFARDIFGIEWYPRAPEKAPIRWYAPESVMDNMFSTKSDVWSFGIVLFEIATLGRIAPYKESKNDEVRLKVSAGMHPRRPPYCDDKLFDIMKQCWSKNADDRPSFSELVDIFEDIQDLYPDPTKVEEDEFLNEDDEECSF